MEVNHPSPVFLPRLVPHIFNRRSINHRSSARLTMPDRSPSPMSTTPPNSHSPPGPPQPDPLKMITCLTALVDGNVEAAAITFFELYQVNPNQALAALDALSAGDHQSHCTLSLLIKQLFVTRPVQATSILVTLWGSGLRVM